MVPLIASLSLALAAAPDRAERQRQMPPPPGDLLTQDGEALILYTTLGAAIRITDPACAAQ